MKKDAKSAVPAVIPSAKLKVIPKSVLSRVEILKEMQKKFPNGTIIMEHSRQNGTLLTQQLLETQDINYDKP